MKLTEIVLILSGLFLQVSIIDGCNEVVCASRVTFCLLENFCNCDYKNCTCCKTCSNCLGDKFFECCSCVDVCPVLTEGQPTQSSVDSFPDNTPELFNQLAKDPAPMDMWKSYKYPVEYNAVLSVQQIANSDDHPLPKMTCTVIFMAGCMSERKCRRSCLSLGASGMRWFHNGCCECIGDTCINYGMAEPKCTNCSSFDDDSLDEDDEETYYYDEE